MVTKLKDRIRSFFSDFYFIAFMTLLFPLFFLLWMVSIIKGESLFGEEGE